jgi:hypothetical protein
MMMAGQLHMTEEGPVAPSCDCAGVTMLVGQVHTGTEVAAGISVATGVTPVTGIGLGLINGTTAG